MISSLMMRCSLAGSILIAWTSVAPASDILIARAQTFRRLVQAGDVEQASRMAVAEPRLWFEAREGDGRPLDLAGEGPWKAWDEHFRSRSEVLGWTGDGDTVVLTLRETNDYYLLLERGWSTLEVVYDFDARGLIEGQIIRSRAERPLERTEVFVAWSESQPGCLGNRDEGQLIRSGGVRRLGRPDEFLAWAKKNEPAELEYLMPGGEIDPRGDRALRTHGLLLRWREASGLPKIHGIPDPC